MKDLASRTENVPLWGPLASVLLAFAWLMPNSSQPWVAFQKEFAAGITFALIGLTLAARWWRTGRRFEADPIACVLALTGLWALGQWSIGLQYFFGHAAIGATYLLGAAGVVIVGRAWEAEEPGAVARWLFPAVLVGALGTTGLILKQWLGVDGLDVWSFPMPPNQRPFGNMLQPNNAATLLVLGVLAVFWLHLQRRIGRAVVLLAGGYLLFGMVVTQSRAGYLNFLLLAAAGTWFAPRLFGPGGRRTILLLVAWFVAVALLVPQLNAGMGMDIATAPRTAGGRWEAWRAFGAAALEHPLTGLGFFGGVLPQMAAFEAGHQMDGYFAWAHNAFLDIAVWFGLPVALAVVGACLHLAARVTRAQFSPALAMLAAAALVPLLHGMVELPLGYAFFLLPLGLLLGAISAHVALPAVRLDARAVFAVAVVLAASTVVIGSDYLKVERSFYALRFKVNRIGFNHPLDLPETLLLRQHRAYFIGVRLPVQAMDPQQARDFEHAVALEPSPGALYRLVTRLVEDGDLAAARHWIEVSRQVNPPEQRRLLAQSWHDRAAADRKYAQVQWLE